MISWRITNRENWGASDAPSWDRAILDVEGMFDRLLEECIAFRAVSAYVEMWPDSGCFICYPADPPKEGVLAERETGFLVQLRLNFWREKWDEIGDESAASEDGYLQLRGEATSALREALSLSIVAAKLKASCPEFSVYAFEYEGTEGVTELGIDGVEKS